MIKLIGEKITVPENIKESQKNKIETSIEKMAGQEVEIVNYTLINGFVFGYEVKGLIEGIETITSFPLDI